ncbi:MAG TPA: c-type cytochrome [Blastocatellia bacterium]|nr:c-type cytochrome [Blastocatellia bacterium]
MTALSPKLWRAFAWLCISLASVGLTSCSRQLTWPAPVQKVPEESKPLTPEQSMKTVVMPPGYRLELVASEPLVQDPVAIEFGPDGRLWVIEMPGFMPENADQDSREPSGRIVTLEDTNDDGKMDKRTVFLDGLVLPRAVKVLDKGVLVGEPPNLWLARDTNGDGKSDAKELLHDQYGRREANPEHNANSLLWGMDNVLHTSEHNFSYRFKNGKFEAMPTLLRGQWGMTMDDAGRIYRNWNEQPLFVDVVAASYFMRNPNIVRTRGSYEELISRKDTATWPIRPTRGVNRGYRDGVLRPDGTITSYQSAATPLIYRGDQLPKELQGNAFVTDCTGQLVHRLIVNDDGTGRFSARDAYPNAEFIASTDEWFRPVNLANGPDGTFYIVDMYRGVVQDGQYQTDYLRDYIKRNKLQSPVGLGRIYRVIHETSKRETKLNLQKESSAKLVELLAHPNGWRRDWTQQLLVERGDKSVVDALKHQALKAADFRTKLHALWTLDGLDALDAATVTEALNDGMPDVRAAALRLSERWLGEPNHPLQTAIMKCMAEPSWIVRRQLAATLGALPPAARLEPMGKMLEQYASDPILVDLVISGLAGQEATMLNSLLAKKGSKDAIEMLTAAISKARNPAATQKLLELAADAKRDAEQRQSLLRGVEIGLSPMRGGGGRPMTVGGGAAPAGGAAAAAGGGGGRTAPVPPLTFPREPAALKALQANSTNEIAGLAKRIAGRVTWPGKPEAQPEVPKLTAEEEQRFAAGQQLYASVCAGCHQPDGFGKEKIAPALVQSQFATGNAAVMIRIVLSGKEGTIGLMPPQGQALSDEQIAAVLTYVRREWGHTASPVAPADVKEVRGMTASRKTPWTEAELTRLLNAGPGGAPASRAGQ